MTFILRTEPYKLVQKAIGRPNATPRTGVGWSPCSRFYTYTYMYMPHTHMRRLHVHVHTKATTRDSAYPDLMLVNC